MAERQLTDTERLEIAVDILSDDQLEEYKERCEKLEQTPPLWEAGKCPACGGDYYGEVQEIDSDDESETRTYICSNCSSTVKEYFELIDITTEP